VRADAVPISAHTGHGIPQLLQLIETRLTEGLERVRCKLPTGRGDLLAWLKRAGRIVEEYYLDGAVTVTALVPPKVAGQLRKRLPAPAGPPC
jgi:GTP-binding protein HflX